MRGPAPSSCTRARRLLALAWLAVVVLQIVPSGAAGAPPAPTFGPVIEGYAEHVGPTKCRPKPKPGVLAVRDLLMAAYPDTAWIGMGRACSGKPTSEHQEGRALDWARDASVADQRIQAQDFLAWLLATDAHGNRHAAARRLGITYIIWNRRIWSTWEHGWEVYCVQRRRQCKDPKTKAPLHPHSDHMHISFGWPGARMETSFWHPELSQAAPEPSPTPSPPPTL